MVGQAYEAVDVRLDANAYDRARRHGLRYDFRLPFTKAGGYQIRAAWLERWGNVLTALVLIVIGALVLAGLL